jgi:DNA-binding SARP family transcriptional activator
MSGLRRTGSLRPVRPGIHLSVLGGLELCVNGRPVAISPGSQRLIALLAVFDQGLTRVQVTAHLWPDVETEHSFGRLRSALWRLRDEMPRVVEATSPILRIDPQVEVDYHVARQLAWRYVESGGQARPDVLVGEALQLLSSELLPGYYEEWALAEAERWRTMRLLGLDALASTLLEAGRPAEALFVGVTALGADPLRESAETVVLRAHLAQGNRAAAARELREYERLLGRELGVPVSDHLRQLVDIAPAFSSISV